MISCHSRAILLSPYPDEMLSSVMARISRANGLKDFRRLWTMFSGDGKCSASFIDTQISLPSICARAEHFLGSVEQLLEKCTWVVAETRLGELDASLLRDIVTGSHLLTLSELTFAGRTVLKLCPRCIEEDAKERGVAYWHRSHQLPLVFTCLKHGHALRTIVLRRSALHSAFPLPLDLCLTCDSDAVSCEVPGWGVEATFAEMLADRNFSFDSSVAYIAILDELGMRNMLTAGGTLRKAELIKALCVQLRYYISQPGVEFEKLANHILRSLISPQRGLVLGRVVLIHWLFGSWQAFKEKCRWVSCLGSQFIVLQSRCCDAHDVEALRQRHRAICMEQIQKSPAISRLEFTKTEYRSFHWLLHRDRTWLDAHLPIPKQSGVQLVLV